MLKKIISGGQTGVDRAALDAALVKNFCCGGWCPQGRRAEDGKLPSAYPLKETSSAEYEVRTEFNVQASDATLIITSGKPTGGTALTIKLAQDQQKPYLIMDLKKEDVNNLKKISAWLQLKNIKTLNIAGPRESKSPGIYQKAKTLIEELLELI